ncbi:MAG: ABC transporter transmembrane domain-containing protein [Pseudomonadota bacterium]|nr:ABC transporter transmembrane domain-containing protein [Pseudomonadota bacterium]
MDKQHPFMRLLSYGLSDKKLLRQALILLLIATAAEVAGPLLIKLFLDDYVVPGHWQPNAMLTIGAAYLFFMILAASTNYLQAVRLNLIAQHAVQTLREQVFAKALAMPLSYFDRTPTGSLISRITNDTESIKELYVNVIGTFIQNIMRILGILIAMALLDWQLMIICLLFVPVITALMYLYQRLSAPIFHQARTLLSDINARLHETIQGIKVLQLLGQEPRFRRDFTALSNEHNRVRLRNIKLDSILLRPLVDMIQVALLAGLLYSFGYQSLSSPVEIGVIYAFVTYLGRFSEPLVEITQRLSLYQQAIVAGERVFTLLDSDNSTPARNSRVQIHAGKIEFRDIRFSYDNKHDVIKNVTFIIPAGQFHAIIGHTGSGKSTLTQLLLRFYAPQQGEIRIDGHALESFSEEVLRQQVGIVQQDPFIFNSSVRDNIAMGQPFSDAAIKQVAKQAGLHEHVQRLPQGYDTIMNERGSNLSTGQRQLLALARTLIHKPKVLILDEATANIDSHTEAQIQTALMQLRGEITLLVIAHRLSTIEKADQILVLNHGELVQHGSHNQLLGVAGVYRHLYEMQTLEVGE